MITRRITYSGQMPGAAIISVSLFHDCCQTYNATRIPVCSIEMRRNCCTHFLDRAKCGEVFSKIANERQPAGANHMSAYLLEFTGPVPALLKSLLEA
ncbi:MAG TPA: hypothetical protein VFS91_09215, partial [Nitrobacter sp.]|nr:hypothetical protein [Nitrobacter sp.]